MLVEEVVDTVRTLLRPGDLDYLSMSAGQDSDRDIWAVAHQYPLTPGAARLILIRDAERLRRWEPLEEWLINSRRLPTVYLMFVTNETDFTSTMEAGKRVLATHLERIKARGHIVRCAMPNERDAIAWLRRRAALDDDTARYLLTRVGGHLDQAAAVAGKLALFAGTAGTATIDQLCTEVPAVSFVEAMIAQDKPKALAAGAVLDDTDLRKAIGVLDLRLDLMAALHRAVRAGYATPEVQKYPQFLARQFMPYAKHYDDQRTLYCRRVLAAIDDARRTGAQIGLTEALIGLW